MGQAIRQAVTQIARSRAHGITVVAIMALSVGSCVAIFAMVKAVLLADLGYRAPARLAILWHSRLNVPGVIGVSPGDYASYRESLRTTENLSVVSVRGFNLGTGGAPARISCARMTASMFPMLGVAPMQGRWFSADEEQSRSRVVVISHRLWKTQLAGKANVIDSELSLDAVRHRVVGVMPEAFTFPPEGVQGLVPADCWVAAAFSPIELATPAFNHVIFARIRDGVSWGEAQADAHAGAQRIWSTYPAAVQAQVQLTARIVPVEEQTRSRSRIPLYLFIAAVAGLLLIGCANVSNVLLTAFEARQGELAVRASLGATRRALVVQLLTESVAVSVAGGALGVLVAWGLLSAMVAANATAFPRLAEARVDPAAILFAIGCGVVSSIAATLIPAWRATGRSASSHALGARNPARAFGGSRWRRAVIAFELSLAVAVLVIAGVLARSVDGLHRVDTGLAPDGLLTFSAALAEANYQRPDQIEGVRERLLARLKRIGRVDAVAIGSAPPIGEGQPGVVFAGNGASTPQYQPALVHQVTAGFADALRLSVRRGRFIEDADAGGGPDVAVVNESLARVLFPDGDAVGRSFSRIGAARPHTIVGIVGDVRQGGPLRPAPPALYVPMANNPQPARTLHVVIRSGAPPGALSAEIRRALADVDAELPAFAMRSGTDLVNGTIAGQRFNMLVVGVFAAFALMMAIGGLYSVLAHAVQQARRDFGIRQALGATAARIVGSVLTRALWPALAGIGAGVLAASAASELISSLLFGVRPNDPVTLVAVVLLVLTMCLLAVLAPARRAARADLMTLLRHD
jgi:putative ABC transport system permease protein